MINGRLRAIAFFWLALVPLAAFAGAPEDPILFESSAPGIAGGGLGVSNERFPGHTFRLTQRAHISAVGTQLSSFSAVSVFAGLYRVGTPVSPADVIDDSNLVAVTLLEVPTGGVTEVSGAMDVDLEPGWYALVIGQGRHGATATGNTVTLTPTGTAIAPQSWGPYSLNTSTGQLGLQGTTTHLFVRGQFLPPQPPPAGAFVLETARPAAWWSAGYMTLNQNRFLGRRFTLTRHTRIDRVSTWLYLPSEPIFAAIFPLAGTNSLPPSPSNPAFESLALASALIETGTYPEDYGADFGGLELAPGNYALVFGTGRFGATGEGGLITVADEIVTPGSLYIDLGQGSGWLQLDSFSYSMRLTGIEPELTTNPSSVDFGGVPVGARATRTITLRNLREQDPLTVTGMQLTGTDAARYSVVGGAGCSNLAAAGQCQFDIEYQPTVIGDDDAVLEIGSDGIPDPYRVTLAGAGLASATVTPLSAPNGSIDPAEPQIVALGTTPSFTLVPDPGYHLDTVTGTCGGNFSGQTFTIDPVTADCTLQPQFALNPATTLSVLTGTPQSAEVASSFGSALAVHASNDAGLPVPGVSVEFAAPQTGASASVQASAVTDASGNAQTGALANTIAGSYLVEARVADIAVPAVFALSNLPGPAQQMQMLAGDGQTALVGTAFALPLSVRISDVYANPLAGISVDFTAPSSGASATLATGSVLSNANGEAAIGASANAVPGKYVATAAAAGLATVPFALINRAPDLVLSVGIDDDVEYVRYGETVDYHVTIHNAGTDAATGVSLQVPLPEQLDADAALWTCLDLVSGCVAEGSGPLQDAGLRVGAGSSVRWLLSAPVRVDAPGAQVDVQAALDATYHPPLGAGDQDWLVLLRDGFDGASPDADANADTDPGTE